MFKKIDLFGQPVFFRFNGSQKSKSSAGAWFSLLLFGFVLWAVYNVGQDIIFRRNPKIIMSEAYSEDPKPMVLSDETFSFAAGLQVPITYAHYINESIYKLEAHFTRQVREIDENGTLKIKAKYISLELEKCTKGHFGIHAFKFENLELSELYCLKKEQPGFDKLVLQGTFESSLFQSIELVVTPCDPETSNVTCAPQETLNEMLGSCYFAVYYTNLAIDAKNSTNPNFTFRDSYYTTVSNSFFKDVPIWLTHVQVKSDFGWLLETENIKNFVRVGYVGESASFMQKNQKRMINVRIRMDKITINYERSYLKMGDIFGAANGFAATGLIVIFIFLGPYSKIKFYERLINELFDLRMLKKETKENSQKRNSTRKLNTKPTENKNEEPKKKIEKHDIKLEVGDKSNQHSMLINEFESFSKLPYSDDENNLEKSAMMNLNHLSISQLRSDQAKKPGQPIIDLSDIKSLDISPESNQSPSTRKQLRNFDPSPPSRYAAQNSEKRQAESKTTCSPATAKLKYSSDPLFRSKKPEMTAVKQKVKVLEGYEPSCPAESFMMLESLIMDGHEVDQNTLKQSYLEISPIAKREKAKTNAKYLEATKILNGEKIRQISEEAYEDTDEELDQRAAELSLSLNKESDKLSISFKEYLCSFFWRSKALKAKLSLLNEGIRRIEERLDIFNVLKKFREVDKLKLLFMENEQLVLFDTLPKPELSVSSIFADIQGNGSFTNFKDTRFISEKRKKELVLLSYKRMKKKRNKTMIDTKLLEIYDHIIKH